MFVLPAPYLLLYFCRSLRPVSTYSKLWQNECNGGKCCGWEA